MVPEGDRNCRPKGPQMAEICFQKAPGQDLGQKGRFPVIPDKKFTRRGAAKWPNASKKLPARIRLERDVSQWSQKDILLAGPKALERWQFASKRLRESKEALCQATCAPGQG